jgi:glucan phosphorylase
VIGVNLIPSDVLLAHRRVRRIRRWIMVSVAVAALAVLPVLWRVRQHARVAELTKVQQTRTAQVAAVRAELDRVTASLTDLNERIERANALKTKRSWAGLLCSACPRKSG